MLLKNTHNFIGVGSGGPGVEPPVRKKLGLALGMSGIKVRLGKPNLVFKVDFLVLCFFPEFETC